jgi:Flp pilus assembly protein TadD
VREIWAFWLEPPNRDAGRLMQRAQANRRRYDRTGALALLDQLVARVPDRAEAWNQRATLNFEMGRLDASLDDIETVLALEPNHFGAMAGQAVILMRHGRHRTAHAVLKRALEVHPFLPERRYILPVDGPDQRL